MPREPSPETPRIEVGRYARLAEARERGLVVAARELPHWIERDGEEWVLSVEAAAQEEVCRELAAFNAEQSRAPAESAPPRETAKFSQVSLFLAAWTLIGFFMAQQVDPDFWETRGIADSRAILGGEWWRAITALFLHGDGPHLAANLATGLLFASFLIPRLGSGPTWLAILLSGALGNAWNAWGYRGETHLSLGASTACFGALGLLVGLELVARWREPETRSRWQLILPLGAGFALLAFLGVGEEDRHVDYMAHCWGFLAGLTGGGLAEIFRLSERLGRRGRSLAALAAIALIAGAWLRAAATF